MELTKEQIEEALDLASLVEYLAAKNDPDRIEVKLGRAVLYLKRELDAVKSKLKELTQTHQEVCTQRDKLEINVDNLECNINRWGNMLVYAIYTKQLNSEAVMFWNKIKLIGEEIDVVLAEIKEQVKKGL